MVGQKKRGGGIQLRENEIKSCVKTPVHVDTNPNKHVNRQSSPSSTIGGLLKFYVKESQVSCMSYSDALRFGREYQTANSSFPPKCGKSACWSHDAVCCPNECYLSPTKARRRIVPTSESDLNSGTYMVMEYCVGVLQEILESVPEKKFPIWQAHK